MEKSELLLESLLDKNILIRTRIYKRVSSERKEGIYLRLYKAIDTLNTTNTFKS